MKNLRAARNLGLLFAAGLFGLAQAADWTYTGEGAWTTAGNWKDGAVPAANQDAVNNVGGTMVVSEGMSVAANRLFCGSASGTSGHLLVTGGFLKFNGSATQIGAAAGGTGTFTMTGGALDVPQLQVGASGTGSMTLSGGVVTNRDWSCIGRYAGGVGELTITGTGRWINVGSFTVFAGEQGRGTITVENGGELGFAPGASGGVVLANQSTGVGTIYLKTGGLITANSVAIRTAASAFVLDGGTLRRFAAGDNGSFFWGQGVIKVGAAGGTIDTLGGRQTVLTRIEDEGPAPGRLVKAGTGELALVGGGSFSGGYDVRTGTLSALTSASLPGWRTAPIHVAAGATLALGSGWSAAEAAELRASANVVVDEGGAITYTEPDPNADLVLDVSSDRTMTAFSATRRVVKTGSAVLTLVGEGDFQKGFVVSNGQLRADFDTVFARSHLTVAGATSGSPAYFSPMSGTFTAPVADDGPRTISFAGYAGFCAKEGPLTINCGGAAAPLKRNVSGFRPVDLALYALNGDIVLENPLDNNGVNMALRKYGSNKLTLANGFDNSSTTAGELHTWDSNILYPARKDGKNYTFWHFKANAGEQLFTGATLRSNSDLIVGGTGTEAGTPKVTLRNCDYLTTGGWNYLNSPTGTTLTVDGGSYKQSNTGARWYIGREDGSAIGRLGTFIMTNNPSVVVGTPYLCNGAIKQYSGTLSVTGGGEFQVGCVSNNPAWQKRFDWKMAGGDLTIQDSRNFQVGGRGLGRMFQTGGAVSAASYFCVGRYPKSKGEYYLHGGTLEYRTQANGAGQLCFIAEEGTGTVSVANGGVCTVRYRDGVRISSKTGSYGHLILSPDGLVETPRVYGNTAAGLDNGLTFNGGTLKAYSADYASGLVNSSLKRATVTALGGAVDTDGKGDFTVAKPLTKATRADDLSEALAHRWSFRDGSLKDTVGASDATLQGTAALTNDVLTLLGTKCGTSCVNLGTDILPRDGYGFTVEMWVTPDRYVNWARVFDFGRGGGQIWLSFNRSGTKTMQFNIEGTGGGTKYSTYVFQLGKMHYLTLVAEKDLDDVWTVSLNIYDPDTGARLERLEHRSSTWSPSNINQANGMWLGYSSATADNDPAATYHDVRVYNRALTPAQMAANAVKGADEIFYFRKRGAGSLTLTGANDYACGTAVDAGTLKLAAGAKLPATELFVADGATLQLNAETYAAPRLAGAGTVSGGTLAVAGEIHPGEKGEAGTLTLSGTTLTGGTLVADTLADGAGDRLVSTGTLDLSKLKLKLANAVESANPDRTYVLVSAGEIRGKFAEVEGLPRRWSLSTGPTTVRLVYGSPSVVLFR